MTDDTTMMLEDPVDGRGAGGRFVAGNRHGRGNPHAKQHAMLRETLLSAVTPDDLRAVVRGLVEQAKAGNVPAARELLDRVIGRAGPAPDEQPQGFCLHCVIAQHYAPGCPVDAV